MPFPYRSIRLQLKTREQFSSASISRASRSRRRGKTQPSKIARRVSLFALPENVRRQTTFRISGGSTASSFFVRTFPNFSEKVRYESFRRTEESDNDPRTPAVGRDGTFCVSALTARQGEPERRSPG